MAKNKTTLILIVSLFFVFLTYLFSRKLLDVPMGLTVDETAFGYNAALLAQNGYDENNRFLPLFVLSIDGKDWRQPVTQYYLALLFKIFGPSLFLLRFSSILITLLSTILLFYLVRKIYGLYPALLSSLVFLTTPLVMIQSHMGLDNIMPIPFTLMWLIFLFIFSQHKNKKYLILSAISLGISFYTYKGMRAVVPVWFITSSIYIASLQKELWSKKTFSLLFLYGLSIFPFFAIIPYLNQLYPGAIFDGQRPKLDSIYNFLYPYFSSFDITFLYIKGDNTPYHSTGYHGMFLLSSLPLFILGLLSSIKTRSIKFTNFIILSFFAAPLLYGSVNSIHRASRLMCLIPLYTIICSQSLVYFNQFKFKLKSVVAIMFFVLFFYNYIDFLNFYWNGYAKFTQNFLGDLKPYLSYEKLKTESEKLNLKPYISSDINNPFFSAVYFPNGIEKIHPDNTPPKNSILLTNRENIPTMNKININMLYYRLQSN